MKRHSTLIAALAFPVALGIGIPAVAAPEAPRSGASVHFRVHIPLVMRLTLHDHPKQLRVTAEDAARGYVDVNGARIETAANHPRGYTLQVRLASSLVDEVAIDGLARAVVAGGDAAVAMPPMRALEGPLPVSYRLKLAAAVTPGTYAWPVALAVYGP